MQINIHVTTSDQGQLNTNNKEDVAGGRKEGIMKYRMNDFGQRSNGWFVFSLVLGLGTVFGIAVGTGNITLSVLVGTGAFALFTGLIDRLTN